MLKYNGYTAHLEIDVESGLLLGQVIDVNDAITFQAKTVEEAIAEFHQAVDAYLQVCETVGKEPDKPFSGKMPFRTKPEIHKAIYLAATRAHQSMNAWMEEVLYKAAQQSEAQVDPQPMEQRSNQPQVNATAAENGGDRPQSLTPASGPSDYTPSLRINLSSRPDDYQQLLVNCWAWFDISDEHEQLLFDTALKQLIKGMEVIQPFLQNNGAAAFHELITRIYAALDAEATASNQMPPSELLTVEGADGGKNDSVRIRRWRSQQ